MKIGDIVGKDPDLRSYESSPEFVMDSMVGLEYELEDCTIPSEKIPFWDRKGDGSLRGAGAYEYVLRYPLSGADLAKGMQDIDSAIRELDHPPLCSPRTSVHVHIDVRDLTPEQLLRLISVYYTVEPLLFHYAGYTRKQSNYCIGMDRATRDTKEMMRLSSLARTSDVMHANHTLQQTCDTLNKYAGLNLKVINQFGSVEFRHHGGEWEYHKVKEWVNICMSLKKFAIENPVNVTQFPMYVSSTGVYEYVQEIFGDLAPLLVYPDYAVDVMKRLRLVQPLTKGLFEIEYDLYLTEFHLRHGTTRPNPELLAIYKQMGTGQTLTGAYNESRKQRYSLYFARLRRSEVEKARDTLTHVIKTDPQLK